MAASFTLTATAEPNNSPPRVRLDITETGTPVINAVTVTRTDADGRVSPVRTIDGGLLPVSGGVAQLFDYEVPFGTSVTYQIVEGNAPTDTASVDATDPWLIHIGVPTRSRPVDLRIGAHEQEEWAVDQGVFPILGRREPIVVTGSTRTAPSSSLIVGTDTLAEREDLSDLLADGSALLMNVSPTLGLGLGTAYIAVGNVTVKRLSSVGTDPHWDLTLPYQVVARPAGGTRAVVTWADVAAKYSTWSSIPAGTTWAQLAAGG